MSPGQRSLWQGIQHLVSISAKGYWGIFLKLKQSKQMVLKNHKRGNTFQIIIHKVYGLFVEYDT